VDDDPGDLGASCSAVSDCVEGLECTGGMCLGDAVVTGQVLFPLQNQPDDELRVLLFREHGDGVGDPLVPSLALLQRAYAAPVRYPASFQISGMPAGEYEIVAFVALPGARAARGQVEVAVDGEGALVVNGVPSASASISITGESALDD